MKKTNNYLFYCLIIFISSVAFYLNGQTDDLIKTTEYSGKKKRRDMFLNKDLNVVKESYYSDDFEKIVNNVFYDNNGKLLRLIGYEEYPKITFEVDFSKGTYEIPEKKTILKFKNRFVFDGLQKGDNIVVNYSNGVRQGKLIQTDSAEYGTKTVVYQRPNVGLLSRFNILQFYNEIGEEDTYKVYKGLILNFSNNHLNGRQLGYFVNGAFKFKANFSNGKVLNYSSFNQEGSTLSNIVADSNAIVRKPYILNGVIERDKLNVGFKNIQLQNTGTIGIIFDFSENDTFHFNREGYEYDSEYYYLDGNGLRKREDYKGMHRSFEGIVREVLFEPYVYVDNRGWTPEKVTVESYLQMSGGTLDEPKNSYPYNFNEIFIKKNKNLKKLFDDKKLIILGNNPHVLRVLFGIPFFKIERFDFESKDQTDLEIIENESTQKTTSNAPKELNKDLANYSKFYESVVGQIKTLNSNFEITEKNQFDNWINSKFNMDDYDEVFNRNFKNLINKNSGENLIHEAVLEFSKITILAGVNLSNENSLAKKQELEEYIYNSMINIGHGFLILSNIHHNKNLFENAMNFYSNIPMEKSFEYYDNMTGEKIILKDWKELIKNKVIDKEYIKYVNLKNLSTQK